MNWFQRHRTWTKVLGVIILFFIGTTALATGTTIGRIIGWPAVIIAVVLLGTIGPKLGRKTKRPK